MEQEQIVVTMNPSELERERVNKACQLLIDCARFNGVTTTTGVSACISIALSELYAKGASIATINKIIRLLEQAQAEVTKAHPELEPKA